MKTFGDLKEGDYIYELDTFSGNIDCLKVSRILPFFPNDSIIIRFDKNTSIRFRKDESHKSVFGVIYFCNQEECLDKLSKLTKHYQAVLKTAKQNIKKLKEL